MIPFQTILLFGMPRSGTTWLGKIFDSHPGTLYRHEPDSWGRLNDLPMVTPVGETDRFRDPIREFTRGLPHIRETKVSGSLPDFPKDYFTPTEQFRARGAIRVAKLASRVLGEFPVPFPLRPLLRERPVVIWKSIESLGRLAAIHRALPGSRAVVIIRHPCGYAASVTAGEREGRFTAREPSSEDYGIFRALLQTSAGEELGLRMEDLGGLSPLERLAWRWTLFHEQALRDLAGEAGVRVVRYEDLCSDPEGEARRLMEHAGLAWSPQTQAFLERSTGTHREGYFKVYKDPVRTAHKWHDLLSHEERKGIWEIARRGQAGRLFADIGPGAED